MTALRKILIEEEPEVTATVAVARAPAAKLYVVPMPGRRPPQRRRKQRVAD